jgi:hypothetical protein
VIITGEASGDIFGRVLATGDLNADGETDLAVGAYGYSSAAGRAYIFYNDGSIPTTAATADVKITGEASSAFGYSLTTGDLNADGETDLAVGAYGYSSAAGRAYIFYNDGSLPTTAATADVAINGEASSAFGSTLNSSDLNADGKVDLVVGAENYASLTGRAYIFYNDGSIPTTGATADVIISASTVGQLFGDTLTAGDLNADGKADLVVGSWDASSLTDNVYVFYNDGTYPSLASSADKIFSGSTTGEDFGLAIAVADMNIDGKPDLVAGAPGYSSSTGRVYTFITETTVTATETKAAEFKGSSGVIKGSFELK